MSADVDHVLNVFKADVNFSAGVEGISFFRVYGLPSGVTRFRRLGTVIGLLQRRFGVPFAAYMPSPQESYVITSFKIAEIEEGKRISVDRFEVEFRGVGRLDFSRAAQRALIELLNKIKGQELKERFWSTYYRHVVYPRKPKILRKHGLKMFRGIFYRFNVLEDGSVVLSLDTTTRYIKMESLLVEIRKYGIEWLVKLIDNARKRHEEMGWEFKGVRVFYSLACCELGIEEVVETPISKIRLGEEVRIGGVSCRTVVEFLRARYGERVRDLDENQPGVVSGSRTYAPQYLYRVVPNEEVPSEVLNVETFFMDTRRAKEWRDVNRPARVRWNLINRHFNKHFKKLLFGEQLLTFGDPVHQRVKRFEKPVLRDASSKEVHIEEFDQEICIDFYRKPNIKEVLLYCEHEETGYIERALEFYNRLKECARERCRVNLPDRPILMETDINSMRSQLERMASVYDFGEVVCLGCIKENSAMYEVLTNDCGRHGIVSKCVTWSVIEGILDGSLADALLYICYSVLTRAGGVPWILRDPLHYDCYVAVDIGRSKLGYWAMSIVYDKHGVFNASPGKPVRGEKLEEFSIEHGLSEARSRVPDGKSIILMRHGDVYESEIEVFKDALNKFSFDIGAIISVKSNVPYRIFRRIGEQIFKPMSGDYYIMDSRSAILCGAGLEEYEHGLPQPMYIEIAWTKGDFPIEEVTKDFFWLTYLNWGSPGRSYSLPAPLHLAHKFSKELGWGIQRAGAPF